MTSFPTMRAERAGLSRLGQRRELASCRLWGLGNCLNALTIERSESVHSRRRHLWSPRLEGGWCDRSANLVAPTALHYQLSRLNRSVEREARWAVLLEGLIPSRPTEHHRLDFPDGWSWSQARFRHFELERYCSKARRRHVREVEDRDPCGLKTSAHPSPLPCLEYR
jgi:hypothetical protein